MSEPRTAATWPTWLASMSIADYRLVWAGQLARGINQWAQFTAVPLLVLHLGGTAIDLGVVAAAQWGPVLLLGPGGGVVADRLSKRPTLLMLQGILLAQALMLLGLVYGDDITIAWLLGLSVLFGLANAIELPVRIAYLAELVPSAWIPNAIVLQAAAFHASRMIGPAAAGLVIATVGYTALFAICLGLAAVALVLLLGISSTSSPRPTVGQSVGRDLLDGVRHAFASRVLLNALCLTLVASAFVYGVQAVLPILARDVLGLDSRGYGVLLASMGTGALVAAIPMARLGTYVGGALVAAGSAGAAVSMLVLGTQSPVPVAIAAMFVLGASGLVILSSLNTTVQTAADAHVRGRVIGLYVASFSAGVALGGLLIGLLAEWASVQFGVLACGAGMVVVAAWAYLTRRQADGP